MKLKKFLLSLITLVWCIAPAHGMGSKLFDAVKEQLTVPVVTLGAAVVCLGYAQYTNCSRIAALTQEHKNQLQEQQKQLAALQETVKNLQEVEGDLALVAHAKRLSNLENVIDTIKEQQEPKEDPKFIEHAQRLLNLEDEIFTINEVIKPEDDTAKLIKRSELAELAFALKNQFEQQLQNHHKTTEKELQAIKADLEYLKEAVQPLALFGLITESDVIRIVTEQFKDALDKVATFDGSKCVAKEQFDNQMGKQTKMVETIVQLTDNVSGRLQTLEQKNYGILEDVWNITKTTVDDLTKRITAIEQNSFSSTQKDLLAKQSQKIEDVAQKFVESCTGLQDRIVQLEGKKYIRHEDLAQHVKTCIADLDKRVNDLESDEILSRDDVRQVVVKELALLISRIDLLEKKSIE